MKRWYIFAVLLAMLLLLPACGKSDGAASSAPPEFDTAFSIPTEWEKPSESEISDEIPDISDTAPPDTEDIVQSDTSDVDETDIGDNIPDSDVSGPVIPDLADIMSMTDVEVSSALYGALQGDIILKWGNPDWGQNIFRDAYDRWPFELEDGSHGFFYVYYSYDSGYGVAMEFRRVLDNYWNQLFQSKYQDQQEMQEWLYETRDPVAVLTLFSGHTTHNLRDFIGSFRGWFADEEGNFLGDVFVVAQVSRPDQTSEPEGCYMCVEYDTIMRCVPVKIMFYPWTDADGTYIDAPELPDGYQYFSGTHEWASFAK